MGKKGNFHNPCITIADIQQQLNTIKKTFPSAECKQVKCGQGEVILKLQPTEYSIEYKDKLIARQGSSSVKVFVVNPRIDCHSRNRGKRVPHLYSDGSLCLYYPPENEWDFRDCWATTIIPWVSLWLYYYEVWMDTGEWLGGGTHGKPKGKPIRK